LLGWITWLLLEAVLVDGLAPVDLKAGAEEAEVV
jgi:hypothetical protein